MEPMILPLRRYAQFSGRARRKEFWMWVLFLFLASIVLSVVDQLLGLGGSTGTTGTTAPGQFAWGARSRGGVLTSLFSLATFLPNLAVQVRRLHDVDRSGWWILLPFAPLVLGFVMFLAGALGQPGLLVAGGVLLLVGGLCAILLLAWLCMDGTRGANRFGDDPKGPQDLRDVFR